jgi:photosystem II stability/assembly factor-like uncharacterized protein
MKKTFTLIALSLFSIGANAQWDTLNTQTSTDFKSIAFSDNYNGVAVGYDATALQGKIFHTTDGGQTWMLAHAGVSAKNDVCFSSALHGWVVGDSGVIKRSIDGGFIWGVSYLGTKDLLSVFFLNDTIGFIGGEDGTLYRTSNSGANWDTLDIQSTQPVRDIYFRSVAEGWIVCDGGYIAHTLDSGNTWIAQLQDYLGFFQCKGIAFTETTMDGFIVGNSGMIVNSSDLGLSWDTFPSVTNKDLNGIRFTNSLAGIMCGDSGRIYRTNTGGFSWADETMSYVTEKLNKICFASDSVAFICGDNGRILKSNIDISSVQSPVNFAMNAAAYPNPFKEELHIVLNLEKASAVQITVTDLSGRIVLEENFSGLQTGETILTPQGISALANGMYVVNIVTSYGSVTLPVVRQ